MSDIAIKVENLSKAYRLGLQAEKAETLVEAMVNVVKAPLRNFRRLQRLNTFSTDRESDDILWALKAVSFEVQRGEVVGFIGRNGAGKSTLLKILSRITDPTEGRIEIHGRVSSLLEVGTGFHPELTGRENVYMNGTILGMKKAEIDRKFDEIVDFSGVERFLDTPVKRYSSGMQVRLAFSVAAHLEPELLIVDEVLAVGDAEFQKKCLGKMQDVAGGGRTVLFVSHNMGAVQNLCNRGIHLANGIKVDDGKPSRVIQDYLSSISSASNDPFSDNIPGRPINRYFNIKSGYIQNKVGTRIQEVLSGELLTFVFLYNSERHIKNIDFSIWIKNQYGIDVSKLNNLLVNNTLDISPGEGKIFCTIPKIPLPISHYYIDVVVSVAQERLDFIPSALSFVVQESVFFSSGLTPSVRSCTALFDQSWVTQQPSA